MEKLLSLQSKLVEYQANIAELEIKLSSAKDRLREAHIAEMAK